MNDGYKGAHYTFVYFYVCLKYPLIRNFFFIYKFEIFHATTDLEYPFIFSYGKYMKETTY